MRLFDGWKRSKSPVRVIAGLGNPGREYALTRHNAGFMALDQLAASLGAPQGKKRLDAMVSECTVNGQKLVLAWPQTFMNDSGKSIKKLMDWYRLQPDQLLVIYDDIDLAPGRLRVRANGGPGTHNGMRSIISCLGNGDFARVRIGIGSPPNKGWDLKDYVLGRFSAQEKPAIDAAAQAAAQAALLWAEKGAIEAMNRFNSFSA
nr:aminoacyl-tRNA hydrolase [bacterium]